MVVALVLLGTSPKDTSSSSGSGSGAALTPISVAPPPANPAADAPCTSLLGDLPTAIETSTGTLSGRPAQSSWTYVAAWGDPAIVLRCGVPRPSQLTPQSSAFLVVTDGVTFLPEKKGGDTIFTAVDRAAYIEITVPSSYAQPPLGPIADGIAKALPAVCLPQASPGQQPVDPARLCAERK